MHFGVTMYDDKEISPWECVLNDNFFWFSLQNLRNFYTTTVAAIFVAAMAIQIPSLNVTSHIKMIVFVAWAAYGILPTLHWAIEMGGFQNTMVAVISLHYWITFKIFCFITYNSYIQLVSIFFSF